MGGAACDVIRLGFTAASCEYCSSCVLRFNMNPERRRSSLVRELSRAQGKIATLEEFIRDRERQFHSAVIRMERRDSLQGTGVGTRVRRAGLSHDMLRLRSMSSEGHEDIPGIKINFMRTKILATAQGSVRLLTLYMSQEEFPY